MGFGLSCWLAISNNELNIKGDRDDSNNEINAIAGLSAFEALLLIGEFIYLTKASTLESYGLITF